LDWFVLPALVVLPAMNVWIGTRKGYGSLDSPLEIMDFLISKIGYFLFGTIAEDYILFSRAKKTAYLLVQ
jgi:hypothetical protein